MEKIQFDDIAGIQKHVSEEFGDFGDEVEISQELINQFAEVTGDHQWIHLDIERCKKESPFGTTIAHGFLTASFLSTVIGTKLPGPGCIYLSQDLRFKAPVRAGETVWARVTVEEIIPEKKRVRLKTVCLVNRPDYVPLLPLLGVDAAISPRLSTANWISGFVQRGAVISSESAGFSGSEILQLEVSAKCTWLGRRLMSLDFPRDAVIGAVLKNGRVLTPEGSTVLSAGDQAVVFALPSGVDDVVRFFSGGAS